MPRRLCMIVLAGVAPLAAAERIDLFVFENADNADVSGLDLWVDVVDQGAYADFVFHNDSSVACFIRSIYVESTGFSGASLADGRIESPQPVGVNFEPGATPGNPPGSISGFGGPWGGNLFDVGAVKPGANKDGVDPGQTLVLQFDYDGITYQQLIDALTGDEPAFRIAQHVQGVGGVSSIWAVNEGGASVVPLPGAAAMTLAGLALVAGRRRR